jgi:hypothetical protein
MIPHEKEMVARLKGKPFALIGINSDGGRSALQKIIKEQGITWRNAVDGDTSGPIATQWNVHGWPTIYVLDAKGVIRHRDPWDRELENAVVALLREIPGAK